MTSLIASALTLVTLSALIINNVTRADPDFGSATHIVKMAANGKPLAPDTASMLKTNFGPADLTSWRAHVTVAGESVSLELSDIGLRSALGGINLTVIDGEMPTAAGEIAITRRLQRSLSITIGKTISFATSANNIQTDTQTSGEQTVVGIIEDPNNLQRRLGVVAPGQLTNPSFVIATVRVDDAQLKSLTTRLGDRLLGVTPIQAGGSRVASYFLMALLSGVAMVELGLLCSAGFAVLARRRLRQFGMLSALGASERNLRVAMTLTGIMVGVVGSSIGIALGYGVSRALQGRFEVWLGWRIRGWGLPPLLALSLMMLAVATSGLSAWWPSRSISRLSIVNSLAARRPISRSAKRSATVGVVTAVGGAALLNWGVATRTLAAAFVGLLLSLGGILLLAPTFVRQIGRISAHLPLAARIAGRDLARHQTRSASALAAIILALGIPLGIVLSSSSAEAQLRAETPNLPPNLALLFQRDAAGRNEPPPLAFAEASSSEALITMQRVIPGSRIVPIQLAYDPASKPITVTYPTGLVANTVDVLRIQVPLGKRNELTWADAVWVATPELLRAWKLDPTLATRAEDLLGPPRDDLRLGMPEGSSARISSIKIGLPQHRSAAPYWIPEATVLQRNLATVTAGWVLESDAPITVAQRAMLRTTNADAFSMDLPDRPGSEASIRLVASLIAYAAALAVLAMTVGLIRSESQDEDHTLAAVGAPARTRRWIGVATTGMLSLSGSILAIPIGLSFLLAMTSNPSGKNPFTVPWRNLTVIPLGIPLVAIIGTYVLTSTRTTYDRTASR